MGEIVGEPLLDGEGIQIDTLITSQIPNATYIVELEIGTSVTGIEWGAFQYCSGLTSVSIPDSVTRIEEWAFMECSELTSMTFIGKTIEQVQAMDNYGNWGFEDTSIIHVA